MIEMFPENQCKSLKLENCPYKKKIIKTFLPENFFFCIKSKMYSTKKNFKTFPRDLPIEIYKRTRVKTIEKLLKLIKNKISAFYIINSIVKKKHSYEFCSLVMPRLND